MKLVYVTLGSTALALGILGIFLPLLPTTPFLLLAAWCYCNGSDRLYGWLMTHPLFGLYIRNYRLKRAITLGSKITALSLMFAAILFCILFVTEALWLRIVLGIVFAGVAWHILSFATLRPEENLRLLPAGGKRRFRRAATLAAEGKTKAADLPTLIEKGCECYLLHAARRDVGLLVLQSRPDGTLLLEELWIAPDDRGRGYVRDTLLFIDCYCRRKGMHTLRTTIDKRHGRAVAAAVKSGFMIVGDTTTASPDGTPVPHYLLERTLLLPPKAEKER